MEKILKAKKGVFVGVSGSLTLLEQQIYSDEIPLIIVQGQFDDKPGVLAATNQRVIFVGKIFFSSVVKDLPYSKLSSISLDSGILNSTVKFEFSGGNLEVKSITKDVAKEFVEVVKQELGKKDIATLPNSIVPPQEDIFDKLKKLGELKAVGILTEQEFEEQKRKILST